MSPSKAWISYSGSTITINHALISMPSEYNTYTFTFTADSQNWPAQVIDAAYNFNVIISCTVTSLTITSQPADKNPFILNEAAFTTLPLSIT